MLELVLRFSDQDHLLNAISSFPQDLNKIEARFAEGK